VGPEVDEARALRGAVEGRAEALLAEVDTMLGRDQLIATTHARGGVFVRVDQGHLEVC
jgi:hypothetical protein